MIETKELPQMRILLRQRLQLVQRYRTAGKEHT
jgi:hypothetical protein